MNGRKRHVLVDTLGRLMRGWVTTADTGDRDGLMELGGRYFSTGVKRLKKRWMEGGYSGEALKAWVAGLK